MKHKHYCINLECDKYRNEEDIKTVCDECLMVAYDNGIEGDQQQTMMIEMGGDVEDHLCEMVEEPELINCLCACRRRS